MRKLTSGNAEVSTHEYIVRVKGTRGTETSKYPEEKKVNTIPKVVASEIGRAQTGEIYFDGVRTCIIQKIVSRT